MPNEKLPKVQSLSEAYEEGQSLHDAVNLYFEAFPRSQKDDGEAQAELVKAEDDKPIPFETLDPDTGRWYQTMSQAGVRVLENGFMDLRRWEKPASPQEKPKLIRQKADGLLSAIRMQDHILEGYRIDTEDADSEYSKLESIEEVILEANELLNTWQNVDDTGKLELQHKLAEVVLALERCRNEFKLHTKDQAEAVMKLKDSRGRDNPSALAARTVGALNDLQKRFAEMELIMPQMAMRKELLMLEKRRIEGVLRRDDSQLNLVLNHTLFKANDPRPIEKRFKDYEQATLARKIQSIIEDLESIHVSPYQFQAKQAIFFLKELQDSFADPERLRSEAEKIMRKLWDVRFILRSNVEFFG